MNLTSGKIQNLITLSAFLYQDFYFSPTEIMKVGGVNKKIIKKNCLHSTINFYQKSYYFAWITLLMSNSVHSMTKTSLLFPLAQEDNLMECVMFLFLFLSLFLELLVLFVPLSNMMSVAPFLQITGLRESKGVCL